MRISPLHPALKMLRVATAVLSTCLILASGPALAQKGAASAPAKAAVPSQDTPAAPPPSPAAPYDDRLMRLSEILGSVAYLRSLCGASDKDAWREATQRLIDRETSAEADRKAKLTAAFNRGFRSFASVYTSCTASAALADERYRAEGATLTAEIVARFGN